MGRNDSALRLVLLLNRMRKERPMSQYDDVPHDMPQNRRPPKAAYPATQPGHSKLVLWGGIGLAAIGTLLAARAVAEALAADPEDRPQPRPEPKGARENLAPRFADMDEEDRRAMRARARADIVDFEDRAEELREAALRDRRNRERQEKERAARRRHRAKARRSFLGDVSEHAVKLATNLTALVAAANAAVDGLQQVSGRTGGIMRDFSDTADQLRGVFGNCAPKPEPTEEQAEPRRDRTHSL